MNVSGNHKQQLAKSFTELAIQNGLFHKYESPSETAKEIADFFNTLMDTIDNKED